MIVMILKPLSSCLTKKDRICTIHINKLAGGGCCDRVSDETSTLGIVTAPAIIAPEGIFKGLDGIKNYSDSERRYYESESESAYW
jgi:hypothetical protein